MKWLSTLLWAIAPCTPFLGTSAALADLPTTPLIAVQRTTCPSEVQELTRTMLRDLPAYINRVYARIVYPQIDDWSYAILASQPNFEPLPVDSSEYPNPADESLQQVFFTVLERQYQDNKWSLLQQHHWLFLARSETRWEVAFMFSRINPYPTTATSTPTPPRESSQETTAQAIRIWLRDCQAGKIPAIAPTSFSNQTTKNTKTLR
ncbi:MAG TPA: hypothetical protein IGS53_13740 [Leptolyngbyaceae cyanobacterium M33_DOE_097]|uniref:Uncharacterized protein n=1 Tax=Oscillatoriales cyanobacterium SpSt-418 TaxID=2282169 RepID=A0A7C3KJ53_9CYAN|nr:hypothetical protein [Leptolyngbyaceae cyanobacterium M33_DOE_097]